jgi:hypothetical protein
MRQLFLSYLAKTWVKWSTIGLAILIILLLLTNLGLAWYFANRTYPNTTIGGKQIGSITFQTQVMSIDQSTLLPSQINLRVGQVEHVYTPVAIGVSVDQPATVVELKKQRSWLPLYNLLAPTHIPLLVTLDSPTLNAALDSLIEKTKLPATDAMISRSDGQFLIEPARNGQQISKSQAQPAIVDNLQQGVHVIVLPTSQLTPQVAASDLQSPLEVLQNQLRTPITFTYGTTSYATKTSDVINWYIAKDGSFILDDAAMTDSIKAIATDLGISASNTTQAVAASRLAIEKSMPLTFHLARAAATINYNYCVAVKGVDASNLPALQDKLASVLNDSRGWGMGGKVRFSEVTKGCMLMVWLSTADQMTSFSSACDAIWSCTIKPNVIINIDRWNNATTSWNAAGRNLDDYRTMAINHETGHWLGFGHVGCGGAGQLAPVMQQESVDLQGCVFNEWPLPSEQANLRAKLGI